jgi:hypothetical protein
MWSVRSITPALFLVIGIHEDAPGRIPQSIPRSATRTPAFYFVTSVGSRRNRAVHRRRGGT